jgi:hypothetical protein
MITVLPIQSIRRRADVRARDDASVQSLAESIATVGLINPIRVRRVGSEWEVTAGSHRLAACKSLGLVDIECIIVEDDDLHAELAMIDENLMRAELSASDRATQTARRKAIYLELHPETAEHVAGGVAKNAAADFAAAPSFTKSTAAATGAAERTVRLDAERGEKVIPEVMEMIKGTRLDTGTFLDRIKRLPPNEQVTVTKRELAIDRQRSKPVKVASNPKNVFEVQEEQVAALMSAWNRASKEAREEFLSRIDTPVFDRMEAAE